MIELIDCVGGYVTDTATTIIFKNDMEAFIRKTGRRYHVTFRKKGILFKVYRRLSMNDVVNVCNRFSAMA